MNQKQIDKRKLLKSFCEFLEKILYLLEKKMKDAFQIQASSKRCQTLEVRITTT